jgi:hypothetical protein
MSSFNNAQIAYDNMLPPSYYENDYDFSEYDYEEVKSMSEDDDYYPEYRKACKRMMNSWNCCPYCGKPNAHFDDVVEMCEECANYEE